MFGNPGTVEQGFLDAMRDYPDLKYILTLQESIAVMVADGYARATKSPRWCKFTARRGWEMPSERSTRLIAGIRRWW